MILKTQLHIFFNALSFFTRIPPPKWVIFSKENSKKSLRYICLVGLIVGGIGAVFFIGSESILPKSISVAISMIATIYCTGGFHEDGFADVCDGFGGGWTKAKILSIMKDSQIGAYGTLGLIFILLIKFLALYELPTKSVPLLILSGHAVSRLMAVALIYKLPYVSSYETSKSKAIAQNRDVKSLVINISITLIALMCFKSIYIFITLIPVFLSMLFLAYKFEKWIGGQTGDCAGATQQLCEVIYYISVLVLWKFI